MLILHQPNLMHYVVTLERSRVTLAEVPTQCSQNERAKKVKHPLQKKVKQRCRTILKLEEKMRKYMN